MAIAPTAAPAIEVDPSAPLSAQPWPKPSTAWYALFVFALSLMVMMIDRGIFGLLIEMVKRDFGLSDVQVGLLLGPAAILFYVFVGIPMARLVDIYPRNIVLSAGMLVTSVLTAAGGLVQSYGQLFGVRMITGAGGSAHGPGTYSMLADYFPPRKLPRAIAGLQCGFIVGTGGSLVIGGALIAIVAHWPATQWMGLTIYNWQWVLIFVGLPGVIVAAMVRALPEPPRRGKVTRGKAMPVKEVLRGIWDRRGFYFPLMIGLGIMQVENGGLSEWRAPFLIRTYGWTAPQVGAWTGIMAFVYMPLGLLLGTWLTERWIKQGRKDAPVRVTTAAFTLGIPFLVAGPLMPTGELSLIVSAIGSMFTFAAAVPQNAAIQTVTPNEMRGQVTAVYLFMFTVFQALGSLVIALVTRFIVGDEAQLWKAMFLTAIVLLPLAAITVSRGMKPYAREVERLEAAGMLDLSTPPKA